jgi:hypothetical protein
MPERHGLAQGQQYNDDARLSGPNDARLNQHQYSFWATLLLSNPPKNVETNRQTLDIAQCKCYQE